MYTYNGGYPLTGYYMPDDEQQTKILFKCKYITEEGAVFFNRNGVVDVGTKALIVTPKEIKYVKGARVVLNGIRYSVQSIQPYIPDKVLGNTIKTTINAEYLIQLV